MKKILIICSCIALLFAMRASAQQKVKVKSIHRHNEGWSNFGGSHVPGTWVAYIEDEKVHIDFTGEDWNTGRSFLLSELGTLPEGNEGTFKVTRESGTVTFKGEFEGGKGRGFYSFAENPTFKSYLEQKGYSALDKQLMLDIFFTDINKGYFDFLKENGYASVNNENLKDLAQQDLNRKVMEDYFGLFKSESWGHPPLDKIVELREHGVNARFVNSFRTMGFKQNIPLDKALELRDHGVTPEFITSIQKMGYEKITLDRATELRDHGVNPEFIHSIQDMGYKDITLEKAQELRDHGVNPEFIRSISELGFKNLTLDKARELRDHGVNAEFIRKARGKGVKVETLDDYIRLKDTGFND
ncbi:hypothetical protein [Mucilaginibacter sp.]|uniref:hypothetical protein n=1 Tax=Mucilaginibacter sp. TaxID=1882438 RepID=UPI00284F3E0C|nr:hypothetical protein [Mucilaginibacter sp.]MDR3697278.1 hypothetical protein [Mucilaginibacter sp.]